MNYSLRSQPRSSSAQPKLQPGSVILTKTNLHLARPSSQPSASASAIRNVASDQAEDLTLRKPTKCQTPTFEPQCLIRSPFSRNGTAIATPRRSTVKASCEGQSSKPPNNMALKILQAQEKSLREGLMPSGFGSCQNSNNQKHPQLPDPTIRSYFPVRGRNKNASSPEVNSRQIDPTNEKPLNLSRPCNTEIAHCRPVAISSEGNIKSESSTSKLYQNMFNSTASSSRASSSCSAQGQKSPIHSIANKMQGQPQNNQPFSQSSSNDVKPGGQKSSAGNSTSDNRLSGLTESRENNYNNVGPVKIRGPHPSHHHLHPYQHQHLIQKQPAEEPPQSDSIANRLRSRSRASSSSSSNFRSTSPFKPIRNARQATLNKLGNSPTLGLISEVVNKMRMTKLDSTNHEDAGSKEMEVDEQLPHTNTGGHNGHNNNHIEINTPQKAFANHQGTSGGQKQPSSHQQTIPLEKIDHTIFKGLSHITLEGGFTDRMVDKLEENYLKCRNMVLTKQNGIVTPYNFLLLLCNRMNIGFHEEHFYFRNDVNSFQYRAEIYIQGFCGVGHGLSSGFSSQLAATHLLERLRIFFKIRQTFSYALYPGSKYTKIKAKLDSLCKMYKLGNPEHRITGNGNGSDNSPSNNGPRYECSCVVRKQETCVRSDSSHFGSLLAAKNMYLNFVRPPIVPVVQIKDYFAMGAECPLLKEIHPSLLLNLPSPNKSKWMVENEVAYTDLCLQEVTNESSYLIRPQYTRGRLVPRKSVINKDQRLAELNASLVSALEWIQMETQKRIRGNTVYGLRRRNRPGLGNPHFKDTTINSGDDDEMIVDGEGENVF